MHYKYNHKPTTIYKMTCVIFNFKFNFQNSMCTLSYTVNLSAQCAAINDLTKKDKSHFCHLTK